MLINHLTDPTVNGFQIVAKVLSPFSLSAERGCDHLSGEQVRRKIPVLGVHWSSDIVSIEDIVLYLVLAPQPRLTKTGIFRRTTAQSEESKPLPYLTGALAPPELVTASLSPMREKR